MSSAAFSNFSIWKRVGWRIGFSFGREDFTLPRRLPVGVTLRGVHPPMYEPTDQPSSQLGQQHRQTGNREFCAIEITPACPRFPLEASVRFTERLVRRRLYVRRVRFTHFSCASSYAGMHASILPRFAHAVSANRTLVILYQFPVASALSFGLDLLGKTLT